ncbi:ROK family protein [Aureimonas sp. AU12]|uniref:ROK family protein n=1 Tax=Aureimonas sp. AU12 TaxID=1638161 RepID=UPI000783AA94|nr:ROK family protein [Aureimonas sp. AU12]
MDATLSDFAARARAGVPRVLAADIGGSFVKFAAAGEDGRPIAAIHVANPSHDWDAFCAVLADLAAAADPGGHLPLAISVAGTIDPVSGRSLAANIGGITGHSLRGELGPRLGRPVAAANDADCFALAEALEGVGRGHRNVFGVILGTGVGGGLVIDGRIVEGTGGVSGEWGHGPIVGERRVGDVVIPVLACGCGQTGCLDTVGGARGLERLDATLNGSSRDSRAILKAWLAGEEPAKRTFDLFVDMVSGPLALVVNVVGASLVPVGGGLANVPELVVALDTAVRARILRKASEPLLRPAVLGADAGLIGAALLALRTATAPR